MKKKSMPGADPNSIAPFLFLGTTILAGGIALYFVLERNRLPEQSNDAGAIVLALSIVLGGIMFIAAWAKRA